MENIPQKNYTITWKKIEKILGHEEVVGTLYKWWLSWIEKLLYFRGKHQIWIMYKTAVDGYDKKTVIWKNCTF